MAITPAFPIPLDDEQTRTLGELAVIQGQIEFVMSHVAQFADGVARTGAYWPAKELKKIPGLSLGAMIPLWKNVLKQSSVSESIKRTAESFADDLATMVEDRNDFLHAAWMAGPDEDQVGLRAGPLRPDDLAFAFRQKTFGLRSAADLQIVRDQAAAMTHRLYDLWEAVMAEWRRAWSDLPPLPGAK